MSNFLQTRYTFFFLRKNLLYENKCLNIKHLSHLRSFVDDFHIFTNNLIYRPHPPGGSILFSQNIIGNAYEATKSPRSESGKAKGFVKQAFPKNEESRFRQ